MGRVKIKGTEKVDELPTVPVVARPTMEVQREVVAHMRPRLVALTTRLRAWVDPVFALAQKCDALVGAFEELDNTLFAMAASGYQPKVTDKSRRLARLLPGVPVQFLNAGPWCEVFAAEDLETKLTVGKIVRGSVMLHLDDRPIGFVNPKELKVKT